MISLTITFTSGSMYLRKGDYLVKGSNNYYFVTKPDSFERDFELIVTR